MVVDGVLAQLALDGEVLVEEAGAEFAIPLCQLAGFTLERLEEDVVRAVVLGVDAVSGEWPEDLPPESGLAVPVNMQ